MPFRGIRSPYSTCIVRHRGPSCSCCHNIEIEFTDTFLNHVMIFILAIGAPFAGHMRSHRVMDAVSFVPNLRFLFQFVCIPRSRRAHCTATLNRFFRSFWCFSSAALAICVCVCGWLVGWKMPSAECSRSTFVISHGKQFLSVDVRRCERNKFTSNAASGNNVTEAASQR